MSEPYFGEVRLPEDNPWRCNRGFEEPFETAARKLAGKEANRLDREIMSSVTTRDIARIFNVPEQLLNEPKYNLNRKTLIL